MVIYDPITGMTDRIVNFEHNGELLGLREAEVETIEDGNTQAVGSGSSAHLDVVVAHPAVAMTRRDRPP